MKPKKAKSIALPALLIALLVAVAAGGPRASEQEPLRVVDHVELEKYMGLWYTIASIPQVFTKSCAGGTTARYALRDDGDVKVYNSCFREDGSVYDITGRAWVADEQTRARLKVTFIPFLRLDFLAADYWVIDLDENYQYAVVGTPDRNAGWILARTRELPEKVMEGIKQRLIEQGYDYSRFEKVKQKGFPPPPKMD
ncbi:MAG: lipocalin family protein [bacterium]